MYMYVIHDVVHVHVSLRVPVHVSLVLYANGVKYLSLTLVCVCV